MILFGSGGVTLAASMGQAFSIQTIFIPILRKSKNRGGYPQYILITFVSGFVVYTYIAYMGSFGNPKHNSRYPKPVASNSQPRNN